MPASRIWIAWAAAFLIAIGGPALAQAVLAPIPALTGRVVDATNTLDAQQERALSQKLAAIEAAKGSQVVFLLVPSTQPEDIASYANRVGNAWKIGRKDVGDGLLLVVAKEDRKVRIEVAKALEGAVPDLAARQVIETAITPAFRRGDYAGGLDAAADQLGARIRGEALPAPAPERSSRSDGDSGFDIWELGILAFFAVPVAAGLLRRIVGHKLAALGVSTGMGTLALLATSSMLVAAVVAFFALVIALTGRGWGGWGSRRGSWHAGGWSVGSGGWGGGWSGGGSEGGSGGFSSSGGGDFGGGGASGDW